METELNRLIDKIKKEGVEQAQRDAENIIKEAKEKTKELIKNAEREKDSIIKDGKAQADNFRKQTEKALKQSARDVLLTLKERITDFSDRMLNQKIKEELKDDILCDIIVKMISNFRKDSSPEIEILLNEKDRQNLEKLIFGLLGKEAKKGLTIKGSKTIEKGFRIGEKGKESYIDFTDEAITETFKRYLNPKLAEMLDIGLEPEEKQK